MPIKSFSIKAPSDHNFVIGGSHGVDGGECDTINMVLYKPTHIVRIFFCLCLLEV